MLFDQRFGRHTMPMQASITCFEKPGTKIGASTPAASCAAEMAFPRSVFRKASFDFRVPA